MGTPEDVAAEKYFTPSEVALDDPGIREWVVTNVRLMMPDITFTLEDIDHLVLCLEHLYRHYTEGYPVGDFLSAVADNNLSESVVRSDDVNRKALYLYVLFLANELPYPWVLARRKGEKVLRKLQEKEYKV